MEALGIIIILIIGGILLFFIVVIGYGIFVDILRLVYFFLPWIIGISFGIFVWDTEDKMIGNIIVIVSFVSYFPWAMHIEDNKECNCIIHKISNFLDKRQI